LVFPSGRGLHPTTSNGSHCASQKIAGLTSALGQKQTSKQIQPMSALPPKADMDQSGRDVRFVPKAGIYSIPCRPRARQQSLAVDVADGNGGHATIAGKPIKYSRRVSEVSARAAANV
jgi:hypothetical protein